MIYKGRPVKVSMGGPPPPVGPPGVGDHLAAIIRELSLRKKPGCNCAALRRRMNTLGPAGCREHRAELVAALRENSIHYDWGEVLAAGWEMFRAGWLNPLDPFGSMVDEAVRRARATTDRPAG